MRQRMKPYNKLIFFVLVLFVAVFIFALNQLTPLIIDDYSFTYAVDGSKLASLQDIWESEVQNYIGHTGRVLLHTFTQLFLLIGKSQFNIVNTLVYVILTLIVYWIIWDGEPAPLVYLAVCWGMWLFIPVFGQTCLWLIGACNYLWGGTIVLGFCAVYAKLWESKKNYGNWLILPMFLLGLLAGACNENTSGGGLLFALGVTAACHYQKRSVPKWTYAGILGGFGGLAFLVASPGNWGRNSSVLAAEIGSPLKRYASQLAYAFVNYSQLWAPLLFTLVILVFLWNKGMREELFLPGLLFFCSLAANFVMMFVGSYPARAMFGAAMFLVAASGRLLILLVCDQKPAVNLQIVIGVFLTGYCFLLYGMAVGDIWASNVVRQDREAEAVQIVSTLPKGERIMGTPEIRPLTTYNPQYGLEDVFVDPEHWTNGIYAREYGLDEIYMNGNAYRTWGQALILIMKGEYRNEG